MVLASKAGTGETGKLLILSYRRVRVGETHGLAIVEMLRSLRGWSITPMPSGRLRTASASAKTPEVTSQFCTCGATNKRP